MRSYVYRAEFERGGFALCASASIFFVISRCQIKNMDGTAMKSAMDI